LIRSGVALSVIHPQLEHYNPSPLSTSGLLVHFIFVLRYPAILLVEQIQSPSLLLGGAFEMLILWCVVEEAECDRRF